jgi:hypothetical protein
MEVVAIMETAASVDAGLDLAGAEALTGAGFTVVMDSTEAADLGAAVGSMAVAGFTAAVATGVEVTVAMAGTGN